jgi:hypothetical protein
MTTIYAKLESKGYRFEPSPRLNPSGLLNEPWRLIDARGRIVRRGDSRDALEEVAYRYWRRRYLGISSALA